jgi:hypothetical protein
MSTPFSCRSYPSWLKSVRTGQISNEEGTVPEDDAKLRDYFAADYIFHGPGGDLGFDELRAYFASLR